MSGALSEWRRYWPVSVAAAAGYSVAGLQSFGLGPFVTSLEQAFGWSRAEIMMGPSIAGVFSLLFSVIVGLAVDRFGPRKVGLLGVIIMCGGFSLLSSATGSILNWVLLWGILSLGIVCVQPTVWTSAVASRFDRGRGFAIAVALAGSSFAAAVAPLLAAVMLPQLGWRLSMAGMGAVAFAFAFPVVLLFFRGKHEEGILEAPQRSAGQQAASSNGATVREALRLPAFWVIGMSNFAFVFYSTSLGPNLLPLLGEKGASMQAAAQIASIIGIVGMIARLSTGFLLDKFSPRLVSTIVFLLPIAGGALMLVDSPGYLVLALAVASFGATLGAEYDVIFYLTSRHMGLRNFGVLMGLIMTAGAVAGILAPVAAGWVHDETGSYDWLLMVLMGVMSAAAFGMASLRPAARE